MPDLEQKTQVISPDGRFGFVPNEDVQDALKRYGYRLPTQEEQKRHDLEKEYSGGFVNTALAAGAGALRGGTLGLSDLGMRAAGVNMEAVEALREFNPVASGIGEYGTIAASVALGPGLPGLLARGTMKVGARAVGLPLAKSGLQFVGEVAGKPIENALVKSILGVSIAGTVEGAAYGAGQTVTEASLGDPYVNAQKVFHNIGMGALFGGATAGAASSLGAAVFGKSWLLGKFGRGAEIPTGETKGLLPPTGEEAAKALYQREAIPLTPIQQTIKNKLVAARGNEEWAHADFQILDAFADTRAKSLGIEKDDWYTRSIADIVHRGPGQPPEENAVLSLLTMPNHIEKLKAYGDTVTMKVDEALMIMDEAAELGKVLQKRPELLSPEDPSLSGWIDNMFEQTKMYQPEDLCLRGSAMKELLGLVEGKLKNADGTIGRKLTRDELIGLSLYAKSKGMVIECLYCYAAASRRAKADAYANFLTPTFTWKTMDNAPARAALLARDGKIPADVLFNREAYEAADPLYAQFLKEADNYAQGASLAKGEGEVFRPYQGEVLEKISEEAPRLQPDPETGKMVRISPKTGKPMSGPPATVHPADYDLRGLRLQGTIDLKPQHLVDYDEQLIDMTMRGLKGYGYAKEQPFIDAFRHTNMKINQGIAIMRDKNGKFVENIADGMSWEKAKANRLLSEDTGVVAVTLDDEMTRWAGKQPWIDVVIPGHHSGWTKEQLRRMEWTNYSDPTKTKLKKLFGDDPELMAKIEADFRGPRASQKPIDARKIDFQSQNRAIQEWQARNGKFVANDAQEDVAKWAIENLNAKRPLWDEAEVAIARKEADAAAEAARAPRSNVEAMFSKTRNGEVQGSVSMLKDGRSLVAFYNAQKADTGVHEIAHIMERWLTPEERVIANKFLGVAENGAWNVVEHENWANAFVRYMREGKAPTPELQNVFARFKQWLVDMYQKLVGSKIDVPVSPEIRGLFGDLLTVSKAVPEEVVPRLDIPMGPLNPKQASWYAEALNWDPRNPATAEKAQHFAANKQRALARPAWAESPAKIREDLIGLEQSITQDVESQARLLNDWKGAVPTKALVGALEKLEDRLKALPWTRTGSKTLRTIEGYRLGDARMGGLIVQGEGAMKFRPDMTGPEAYQYLRNIREDIEDIFAYRRGQKMSTEDSAIWEYQRLIDDILKGDPEKGLPGIPGYKDVMERMSAKIQAKKDLLNQFRSDTSLQDSFTRAIERFAFKAGTGAKEAIPPGERDFFKSAWKTIKQFQEQTGTDYVEWYKDTQARAALFQDLAKPGDAGTATKSMYEMLFSALRSPKETAIRGLAQTGKYFATGETPPFMAHIKRRSAERALLGDAAGAIKTKKIGSAILDSMRAGSDLLKEQTPLRRMLVPASVKAMQLLDSTDNLDETQRKVETLIALERARNDADRKMEIAAARIFSDNPKLHVLANRLTQFVKEQKAEKHAEELEKLASDITELSQKPDMMIDRMAATIEGLQEAAPDTAQGITMTATRALVFLSNKLQLPLKGPLDASYVPPKDELVKLARYMKVINSPFSVMDSVANGSVSRDEMEAMNAVYPELLAEMQQRIASVLADRVANKKPIPMGKRWPIAAFLGQDLDRSMSPKAMQMNQIAIGRAKTEQPPMGGGGVARRPGSVGKVTLPKRVQTPMQRVADR